MIMEKYATYTKTFDQALKDYLVLSKDNELIYQENGQQYVVKINDTNCKYYKALTPREI